MDEIIEALTVLAAWYNRREGLAASFAMLPTDFTPVSYDRGEGGSFSVTATNNMIADHYFMVIRDADFRKTTLTQHRLVAREEYTDEQVKGFNATG